VDPELALNAVVLKRASDITALFGKAEVSNGKNALQNLLSVPSN